MVLSLRHRECGVQRLFSCGESALLNYGAFGVAELTELRPFLCTEEIALNWDHRVQCNSKSAIEEEGRSTLIEEFASF
jgi:hypothetical protein